MRSHAPSLVPLLVAAALLVQAPRAGAQSAVEDALLHWDGAGLADVMSTFDVDGERFLVRRRASGASKDEVLVLELANDDTLVERARFESPDPAQTSWFGEVVALQGDEAFVTEVPSTGLAGIGAGGAIHVFTRANDGTWSLAQSIEAPTGLEFPGLGTAFAVDGDRLAVSGVGRTSNGTPLSSNPVLVFERDTNGEWQFAASIAPPANAGAERFGTTVGLQGDELFVAAPDENEVVAGPGRVYVHRRDASGAWPEVQRLEGPAPTHGTFGAALDVDGDHLAISDPNGATVTMYERDHTDADWVAKQVVGDQSVSLVPVFGSAVDVEGDRLVVSRRAYGVFGPPGAAFVYERRDDGAWTLTVRLRSFPIIGQALAPNLARIEGESVFASYWFVNLPPATLLRYDFATLYHGDTATLDLPDPFPDARTQDLMLRAGPEHANDYFVIVGSSSSSTPLPGDAFGELGLDLVNDEYSNALLTTGGAGLLTPMTGQLDANGHADALLQLPAVLGPETAGLTLSHAFFTIDAATFAIGHVSNSVRFDIVL